MEDTRPHLHRFRNVGLSFAAHAVLIAAVLFIAELFPSKPPGSHAGAISIEVMAMAGLPAMQSAATTQSITAVTQKVTPAQKAPAPNKGTHANDAPRYSKAPLMAHGATPPGTGTRPYRGGGGGSGMLGMPGSETLHYAALPDACRSFLLNLQRAPDTPENLTIHVTFTADGAVHHAQHEGTAYEGRELSGQLTSLLNMCAIYFGTTPSYYQLSPGMALRVPRTGIRFYQPI